MNRNNLWSVSRKNFYKAIYAAAVLCAAWGWWGVLYPQLTLTPETYRVVAEEDMVESGTGAEMITEVPVKAAGAAMDEADAEARKQNVTASEWEYDSRIYEEMLNAGSDRIRFRSKILAEIAEYWKRLQREDTTN